jgi:hypothetical protein
MSEARAPRKRGRPTGPPVKKYAVSLYPQDAEWAKTQPGGLSATLRRLLAEARAQTQRAT